MVSGLQVIFIAGVTNLIFLVLVLLTCRCIGMWRLTGRLMKNSSFLKIYNYHCWFWYAFIASVLVHTIVAFTQFGWPF